MKKTAYPVFIKQYGKDFLVYVPDMDIYTEGRDFEDAIDMARDAISLKGIMMEDYKQDIPARSESEEAIEKTKARADNDFKYSDGIMTFVDVDFDKYRQRIRNKSVKKNCTLPLWLSEKAEAQGVNFSRVLQEALIEIVGA